MKSHSPAKRLFCLLLCLPVVLAMALPVSAKPTSLTISHTDAAPVYYRATNDSTLIGYLLHDTALTILGKEKEYYRIDCYDMTGYIHQSFVAEESNEYYVNCTGVEADAKAFLQHPISPSILLQRRIYSQAVAQTGVRYLSGGTSPRGFDCSGFTQYVYRQLGLSIPRTCDGQLGAGIIIPKENLQCGDLVLFQRTTSHRGIATHVGIYLGEGKLIHAGSRGITVVELESAYFSEHYLCARRIILSERLQPGFSTVASTYICK